MRDIVLSMYDLTGKFVPAWAAASYECYCIDVQHPTGETRRGNITFVGADNVPSAGGVAHTQL